MYTYKNENNGLVNNIQKNETKAIGGGLCPKQGRFKRDGFVAKNCASEKGTVLW